MVFSPQLNQTSPTRLFMSPSAAPLTSHPWTTTPCLILPGHFGQHLAPVDPPAANCVQPASKRAAASASRRAQDEESRVAALYRQLQTAVAAASSAARRAEHVQRTRGHLQPCREPREVAAAVEAERQALLALRLLVVEANTCATRAVTQSQHERARALLGPALEAMRGEDTCPASVPAAMVHALSGLNAATLCGMHVAAGRPGEAVQAGEHALRMEEARGDGDNPVGLRLGVAAAQAALGRRAGGARTLLVLLHHHHHRHLLHHLHRLPPPPPPPPSPPPPIPGMR